jgi:hypothetical protein
MNKVLVSLFCLPCVGMAWGQTVPDYFFNMTTSTRNPYPSAYVNGIRLWTTETDWADINTSAGVYDFSHLDNWLQTGADHNAELLYTFGRVPVWASSDPSLYCNSRVPNGECAAPKDLNTDGTGTDQLWKNFVTAVVTHSVNSKITHIKHWELWNEPDTLGNWQGTMAQMVRMVSDASAIIKSLDPTATIHSPAPSGEWGMANGKPALSVWMGQFLAAGGGKYVDRIDFHSYVWKQNQSPVAEDVVPLIQNLKSVVASYGFGTMPIWSSEGSWGTSVEGEDGISDPDMQAAFVARYLLLMRSEGLARSFWYNWASPYGGDGTLWVPDEAAGCTTASSGGGYLCVPGVAYQQLSTWIRGATLTSKCAQVTGTTTWACTFSRPGGYEAEAIWDTSESCSENSCDTKDLAVATQYSDYLDLAGDKHTINNHTVPIGAKPIFLENQ